MFIFRPDGFDWLIGGYDIPAIFFSHIEPSCTVAHVVGCGGRDSAPGRWVWWRNAGNLAHRLTQKQRNRKLIRGGHALFSCRAFANLTFKRKTIQLCTIAVLYLPLLNLIIELLNSRWEIFSLSETRPDQFALIFFRADCYSAIFNPNPRGPFGVLLHVASLQSLALEKAWG